METRLAELYAYDGGLQRDADTVKFIPVASQDGDFPDSEFEDERLVIINQDDLEEGLIELNFRTTQLDMKIAGLIFTTTAAPKCEISTGNCLEYLRTEAGTPLDKDLFRYEINFKPLQYSRVSLKLKADSKDSSVFIFGIDVFYMTIDTPPLANAFDMRNVEAILSQSNVGISEAAERCKDFLKASLQKPTILPQPSQSIPPSMLSMVDQRLSIMEAKIMSHMDTRFKELKDNQDKQFQEIMKRLG